MILPITALLRLMDWVVNRLGIDFDLREDRILDPLDENEVIEQLQHGRD